MKRYYVLAALLGSCCAAALLAGCDSSGTISSLTDSDSTAVIREDEPTGSVITGDVVPITQSLVDEDVDFSRPEEVTETPDISESAAVSAADLIDELQTDNGEPAGEGNTAKATGDDINLRQAPTTEADNVIATIGIGEEVTVLGAEGEGENRWYKVEYQGKTGYVKAEYFA